MGEEKGIFCAPAYFIGQNIRFLSMLALVDFKKLFTNTFGLKVVVGAFISLWARYVAFGKG